MSDDITLQAKKREVLGKQVKKLRNEGFVPAVIHNHGQASVHVSVATSDLKKAFADAGKHAPVKVDVDGKKYTTLIKEVTHVPATSKVSHTVFQAIRADEKASTEVPLNLSEDNPATKASLLVLQKIDHVEIEALPSDLIDVIEVDTSTLVEVGDKITVADLKVPSTITIKTDPEQAIATVEMPKDQIAEADAAAAETAAQLGTDTGTDTDEDSEGEAEESTDTPEE